MKFWVMTLFPELVERVLNESILGRAQKSGCFEAACFNIRDYTESRQRRVDDAPFGGGGGMILQCQPIYDCWRDVARQAGARPHTVYMSPRGKVLTQKKAKELSALPHLAVLCGHYEGVDQRVLDEIVDEEISIGDYVLTGGELPACILIDCVARMLPGVLASEASFTEESHYNGLLEHPQYTQPRVWNGKEVPAVLTEGNHRFIRRWQLEQSIALTKAVRPDMARAPLPDGKRLRFPTEADRAFWAEAGGTHFDRLMQKDPFLNGYILRFEGRDAGVCLLTHGFCAEADRPVVTIEAVRVLPECRGHNLTDKALRALFALYEDQRPIWQAETDRAQNIHILKRLGFHSENNIKWVK